jgi:DNA-binding NarL/FixJ family response regulator
MAANSHVVDDIGDDAPVMTLRCFVVDDSARFLAAVRVLLERQGMPVVGVASNSEDALKRIAELRPDVTLVDVHFGGESGLELARRLARDGAVPPSRLILMSGRSRGDLPELSADHTVAGFLAKSELSADAIRALVGPSDGTARLSVSEPEGEHEDT